MRRTWGLELMPSTVNLNARCAGGYAWISAADTSLLDIPHCELLLIGAKPDTEGMPYAARQLVLGGLQALSFSILSER